MMTKRDRIKASIEGKAVDRSPVGFWRHWPGDDQSPGSLAGVALAFQRRYDLDFIKLPVSSVYCVEDYGITHAYKGSIMGDREYLSRVIVNAGDWLKLEPLDINRGTYGWHLEALKSLIRDNDENTPVIVTMFHPLAMAAYLSGDDTLIAHLRQHPSAVQSALNALAETSARFARACIELGADGIFFSARFASHELLNAAEYRRFGRPADLKVLAAASKGWFNVLHLHGPHPMVQELSDYPVQALNWHDHTSDINVKRAAGCFAGALMGGIEQALLAQGTPDQVAAQGREAIAAMNGRRLILTPGCTYSLAVPEANLMSVRRAVEQRPESLAGSA
ncbi:uroporphyrinogen decarboxylase family protein [Dehalogenimonas sp. 4OHTPN]|uniref:Uroporphyrinogen decarboxylase family protein n=1 Tax=Dehalogenimonas sp. 4OHTPN TaxID=3166643 RepID=A0AAU8G9V8_9CHLR